MNLLASHDMLCFSHLRWDFVYQRPQHLMSRFAAAQRVFFFEEPIWDSQHARLHTVQQAHNVWQVRPHLPAGMPEGHNECTLRQLVGELIREHKIREYVSWYYTPMAMGFTYQLSPSLIVYDCMDELSAFRGAALQMLARETELLKSADLVFTGGQSLYLAKRERHPHVHLFPSSVDRAHFEQARVSQEPTEQEAFRHPRLGYFGVIDERMDLDLLAGVADACPEWEMILVGPIVKIDPETLPKRSNIHYLGPKPYSALPSYLAGWDVALIPFAQNESTRFISPTKTPEYLAGGIPVVSTSIRDVVQPYGDLELVQIADSVPEFVAAVEYTLERKETDPTWLERVDTYLADMSWDSTWARMAQLMERELRVRKKPTPKPNLQIPRVPAGKFFKRFQPNSRFIQFN